MSKRDKKLIARLESDFVLDREELEEVLAHCTSDSTDDEIREAAKRAVYYVRPKEVV